MELKSGSEFRRLLTDFKSPEMRSFWVFIILIFLLLIADLIFPNIKTLIKVSFFIVLGALIFWNDLKLIRINIETKDASQRLNDIVNNLSDGIIAYDANFKVLNVNSAIEEIFGIRKDEILGRYFGPEKVKEQRFKVLAQVIFPSLAPIAVRKTEGDIYPQIMDISFNEPNLEFRVATLKVYSPETKSTGFVKIIHDRTREIQLYKSKSEFITVAAHQLRTPLTAINWTLETINQSSSLTAEEKELVGNGLTASVKVLKLVNDLLDVAKMEEGKFGYDFENVDIIKFLTDILENAKAVAKEYKVNLYLDTGNEPPIPLKIDPNRMGLALSNIIDNSIKYNVENGEVAVKIERLPGKPYVQIAISDTGVGIPAEDINKIFSKFFRAENAVKFRPEGTGFGLYIARNIIIRHGGTIWIESTIGRGTTVYITLPINPNLIPPKEMVYNEQ